MSFPELMLVLATLLCSLVAGFLFAFAVVAMPGLGTLGDREYLRAFRVMDGVIQRQQPLFMLVWVGSVVALVAALFLNLGEQEGVTRALLVAASGAYLLGVQAPTMFVNVPLNHRIQALDVDVAAPDEVAAARADFEARWNRANALRTVVSILVVALLLLALIGT